MLAEKKKVIQIPPPSKHKLINLPLFPTQAAANSSHVESELSILRAELTAVKAQNRSLRASERENHKKLDMEAKKVCDVSLQ